MLANKANWATDNIFLTLFRETFNQYRDIGSQPRLIRNRSRLESEIIRLIPEMLYNRIDSLAQLVRIRVIPFQNSFGQAVRAKNDRDLRAHIRRKTLQCRAHTADKRIEIA